MFLDSPFFICVKHQKKVCYLFHFERILDATEKNRCWKFSVYKYLVKNVAYDTSILSLLVLLLCYECESSLILHSDIYQRGYNSVGSFKCSKNRLLHYLLFPIKAMLLCPYNVNVSFYPYVYCWKIDLLCKRMIQAYLASQKCDNASYQMFSNK